MSFDINKVTIMGRCTSSVEIKKIESSQMSVVNFTIVTNRRFKNSKWEYINEPEYHKCTAYGNSADILGKYLNKGKKVFVEWRLKTRKWTDADGNNRAFTEIVVDKFIFVDSRSGDENDDHSEHNEDTTSYDYNQEEID